MLCFELANQTYELFPKLDLLARVMLLYLRVVLQLYEVCENLCGVRLDLVQFLTPIEQVLDVLLVDGLVFGDYVADRGLAFDHLHCQHFRCVNSLLVYGAQHGRVLVSLYLLFVEFR